MVFEKQLLLLHEGFLCFLCELFERKQIVIRVVVVLAKVVVVVVVQRRQSLSHHLPVQET